MPGRPVTGAPWGDEHRPVMLREVVELCAAVPAGVVIDATVGRGGHAEGLLETRADLWVLGIDLDPEAIEAAALRLARFGPRARLHQGGFDEMTGIAAAAGIGEGSVSAVIFDLGVSSPQLDRRERGFSYWDDAPLDMRMDPGQNLTAAVVVNTYEEDRLAEVLARHGEERFARRIAAEIVRRRPLRTTGELVAAVKAAIPAPARRRGGHPARRTFQALRIEVNRELERLDAGLDEAVHLLTPGGRVLVLAYHSLEDRIVKRRFATWAGRPPGPRLVPEALQPAPPRPLVRILTRRPLRPSPEEVASNPRARSARLRAVERLG